MNLVSTVAYSALGQLLKDASWILTVYDSIKAFISGVSPETEISDAEITYNYTHIATVVFKYVKPSGASDNEQELSHISTSGVTDIAYQYQALTYSGILNSKSIQGNRQITSTPTNYNSDTDAVAAYCRSALSSGACVKSVTLTGIESKIVSKISPICPLSPTQIS